MDKLPDSDDNIYPITDAAGNLPWSREAEQSVVGGLMLSNDAYDQVFAIVTPDDFYLQAHQLLMKAFMGLHKAHKPQDPVTLSEYLQKHKQLEAIGGGAYLGLLAGNTPSAANVVAYAEIVKEKSIERQAAEFAKNPLDNLDKLIALKGELVRIANNLQGFGKQTNTLIDDDDDPIEWLVDGLITTSSRTLLAAKPKVGKTIMSLDIALAVAYGGYAMGKYKCKQGDVLYLALEGGERRLKSTIKRLMAVHQITALSDSFYHETECPTVDNGGLAAIESWCKRVANPTLIVIDILQNFRPATAKNQSIYDADYGSTQALKPLVEKYNVAVLFNHHANKRIAEGDVIDLISGSNGLAGGVDNTLILTRPLRKKEGVLHRIGRDYINDDEINFRLEEEGYFTVIEPEDALSCERKEIVDVMQQGYNSAKEISAVLGKQLSAVHKLLLKMLKEGITKKVGYGKYELVANYSAKFDPSNLTCCNTAQNKALPQTAPNPTSIRLANNGPSSPTSPNPNKDEEFHQVGPEVGPAGYEVGPIKTISGPTLISSDLNKHAGVSNVSDEVGSLRPNTVSTPLSEVISKTDGEFLTKAIDRHCKVHGTIDDHAALEIRKDYKELYLESPAAANEWLSELTGEPYLSSNATKVKDWFVDAFGKSGSGYATREMLQESLGLNGNKIEDLINQKIVKACENPEYLLLII